MIFFVFNNYFPDNSGFVTRCRREIDALSKRDDITVICRGMDREKDLSTYISPFRKIFVNRFYVQYQLIERPKIYIPVMYELMRNVILLLSLSITLIKALLKFKAKNNKLYVVCSPLTVPLIAGIIGYIFKIPLEVLEFHDLEPELAEHIKGIDKKSFVYKIELFLERLLSKIYKKIIVTSTGQAERIAQRIGISKEKIFVIPNTVSERPIVTNTNKLRKLYGFTKKDFILGYFSSFSFDYTITGIATIINTFSDFKSEIKNLKLFLVGDGDGLEKVKNYALNNPNIIFTGKVNNINDALAIIDAGIIPWEKDSMTETILPTKLFDYMASKKTVIAPNYGEFKRILKHTHDSLLYRSTHEMIEFLILLSKDKKTKQMLQKNAYKKYMNFYNPKKYEDQITNIINS